MSSRFSLVLERKDEHLPPPLRRKVFVQVDSSRVYKVRWYYTVLYDVVQLDADRAELDPLLERRGKESEREKEREAKERVKEPMSFSVQDQGVADEIGIADVSAVRRHSRASDHSLNDWRLSSPRDSNLIRERFWLVTRSPLSSRVCVPVYTRVCRFTGAHA